MEQVTRPSDEQHARYGATVAIPPSQSDGYLDRRRELKNIGWESVASYGTIGFSLFTTVIVYRQLGAAGFGVYSGVVALAAVAGPFAAFGFGQVLIRDAASGRFPLHAALGRGAGVFALGTTTGSGVLIFLLPVLASSAPTTVGVLLIISEMIFGRTIVAIRQAARSAESGLMAALPQLASRSMRFVGALSLWSLGSASLMTWAIFHFFAELVAFVVGLGVLRHLDAIPRRIERPTRGYARDGLLYSFNGSAIGLKNDADKAMLLAFGFEEAAGAYALAYRIVTAATQPLNAILNATVTKFFRAGERNPSEIVRMAFRHTYVALALGSASGVALWLTAPLLSRFANDTSTADAASIVRWLAVLPVLIATQQYAARALTATGRQIWVTRLLLAAAAGNVALNAVLIPASDWSGAVLATLMTDLAVGVLLWATLLRTQPVPATGRPGSASA